MPFTVGFTKHVLETGEPLMINENMAAEAERYGAYVVAGEMPRSLLWVPLITGGRANGVISLDNFDREHAFDEADQRLLTTLAGSLSVALENARLVHETRQRNAELALINSVQEAIAGELDPQAIYDAVGDKIQEIFDAQSVRIDRFEAATGLVHYPYIFERGERLESEPQPPRGFGKHVLETCESLLLVEDLDAERERYGGSVLVGETGKSVLFVPLTTGGKATGLISLQNVDREHAFSESDRQLLETLAGSLSVALENARLVHETRQRNAELALINSVQEALAGELEMQAIYDIVGDEIHEIFDAQVVDIGVFDVAAGWIHYPYAIERGVRFPDEPTPLEKAVMAAEMLETKAPLLINDVDAWFAGETRSKRSSRESRTSILMAPLASGDEIRGRISLQNLDRTNAFSENDVRLLTTLASSLSVALENARLVHETRQRNAELALINSVQDAIAGELDPQAIYDAVGDRIQEIFDAQAVQIAMLDVATGLLDYHYLHRAGRATGGRADAAIGFGKHVLDTRRVAAPDREPRSRSGAVRQRDPGRRKGEVGPVRPSRHGRQGDGPDLAAERRSRARLQRVGPAAAGDPGGRAQRGARERAAGARDAATQCRAGIDQQRPGRDRGRARHAGDLRRGRRQDPGDLRRTGCRDSDSGRGGGATAVPVHHRAGRAAAGRADAAARPGSRSTCSTPGSRC